MVVIDFLASDWSSPGVVRVQCTCTAPGVVRIHCGGSGYNVWVVGTMCGDGAGTMCGYIVEVLRFLLGLKVSFTDTDI